MMELDLSRLAPPNVIEELSFQEIFDAQMADFLARRREQDLDYPEPPPSDPVYQQIESSAYREMVLREEFNDRARGLLLAFAAGPDLDHVGMTYHRTERLVIDEGDPDANPPIPPAYESDEAYLERILLALPGFSTAGAREAYIYHARSADGQVKDATCISPADAEVLVTVLSHSGDGTPDGELLEIVESALSAEDVRPLTDHPTVGAADVETYQVRGHLYIDASADAGVVKETAEAQLREFVDRQHKLGRTLYRDAVLARLYVEGVRFVALELPAADIERDETQAAFCSGIELEVSTYE
ncbi:MAG: baseplate J/gp47 family protein [Ectothiorhodospiraceae bacterium]|nr:baseplate J/gp47 family protein [Ectothiorhodospiraceae bacterium]